MSEYELLFHPAWDGHFAGLDASMKKRVLKKISQLRGDLPARHLKLGMGFFVAEVGQYRLCYKVDEASKTKKLFFVGDHKEYERWLGL